MKSHFIYIFTLLTAFLVALPLLVQGAPVSLNTLENINSANHMGLLEPGTLLLLTLGGGGMVYLHKRK